MSLFRTNISISAFISDSKSTACKTYLAQTFLTVFQEKFSRAMVDVENVFLKMKELNVDFTFSVKMMYGTNVSSEVTLNSLLKRDCVFAL